MEIKKLIVKEEEFNGYKFRVLYVVLNDNKEYKIGTLKDSTNCNYVNCVHKEFKKN